VVGQKKTEQTGMGPAKAGRYYSVAEKQIGEPCGSPIAIFFFRRRVVRRPRGRLRDGGTHRKSGVSFYCVACSMPGGVITALLLGNRTTIPFYACAHMIARPKTKKS